MANYRDLAEIVFATQHMPDDLPPANTRTSGVAWDDVVGLDDAKEALREALVYPFTHRELYATYGLVPPKGVLLYGPPGCGKTMLGKAAATAVGADLNRPDAGGFQYVAGPELNGGFVGETPARIRRLRDTNLHNVIVDVVERVVGAGAAAGLLRVDGNTNVRGGMTDAGDRPLN